MTAITTWNRVVPSSVASDLTGGLEARVHDPLWLLARQWQLGELRGEDAGSPITARLTTETSVLGEYRPGDEGSWEAYDPRDVPLEALVEAEAPAVASLRDAADAGLSFQRLLQERPDLAPLVSAYVAAYAFQPPGPSDDARLDVTDRRFARSLAGRVVDGRRLFARHQAAWRADPALAGWQAEPFVDAGRADAVRGCLARWMAAWAGDVAGPAGPTRSAWDPRRMEYRFAVRPRAEPPVELEAAEHHGGPVDWYGFRARRPRGDSPPGGAGATRRTHHLVPMPVTFPGMPLPRWWEFEDAGVDLGGLEAGLHDVGRLVLAEFVVTYGNDWYLVPVELPVGAWCVVPSLTVETTFGERVEVRSTRALRPAAPWQVFTLSGASGGLLLAPALPATLEGRPIERVHVRRDELANVAWAVEERVQSPAGRVVDRHEAAVAVADAPRVTPPAAEPVLRYRLATDVPAHWFPLVAAGGPGPGVRRLRLAARAAAGPAGVLLAELAAATDAALFEEEIGPGGVVVTRAWQHGRWIDGSTRAWIGRRKRVGQGDVRSGLAFDVVE
jgi:hypothetical protein